MKPRATARFLFVVLALLVLLPVTSGAMEGPGDSRQADSTVVGNTGAAQFRIPIEVPPGPGGLAPTLALTYSSHGGDGPFGVGWRLTLGEVRCSIRFGVPDYAACPQYELDGELLIAGAGRYHTFVESFQRIVHVAASDHWEVTSPDDGTVRRYGLTAASRVPSGANTARWLLSEIEDVFGNTITITYKDDPDDTGGADLGVLYPATVAYGPSQERTVEFVYEPRPDTIRDYRGGITRHVTHRLKEVQVKSYTLLVRRTVVDYDAPGTYSTTRSRVVKAQVFGSDCTTADTSGCNGLPPQTFSYTDPDDNQVDAWVDSTNDAFEPNLTGPEYYCCYKTTLLGDVDGDGRIDRVSLGSAADQVYLNDGTQWVFDSGWSTSLQDLMYEHPTTTVKQVDGPDSWASDTYAVCEVTRTTTLRGLDHVNETNGRPAPLYSSDHASPVRTGSMQANTRAYLQDLNGDGRAEIIVSSRTSGIHIHVDCNGDPLPQPVYDPGETVSMVFKNNGSGWEADPDWATGLPPFMELVHESSYFVMKQRYDMLVEQTPTYSYNPEDFPSSFCNGYLVSGRRDEHQDLCWTHVDYDPRFIDLNGDGHLDLIVLQGFDNETLDLADPVKLWLFDESPDGLPAPVHASIREQMDLRSYAWIQIPNAGPGEKRWKEAPRFDLPERPYWSHSRGTHVQPNINFSPYVAQVSQGVQFADLNRDGLGDVIWKLDEISATRDAGVLLNTGGGDDDDPGSAWCRYATGTQHAPWADPGCPEAASYLPPGADNGFASVSSPSPRQAGFLADLNGDGWLDFLSLYIFAGTRRSEAWIHNRGAAGPVWVRDSRFEPYTTTELEQFQPVPPGTNAAFAIMDIDADGAADTLADTHTRLSRFKPGTSGQERAYRMDLVREMQTGRGGTVSIAYASAADQRDGDADSGGLEEAADTHASDMGEPLTSDDVVLWSTNPVVAAVTVTARNTAPATTTYRYAHPRTCVEKRASLGFRLIERLRVDTSVPQNPDTTVTEQYFYQYHGRAGRTSREAVFDGNQLVFQRDETWVLPDPESVPGSIEDVVVGRLSATRSATQYGNDEGAVQERQIFYADAPGNEHGFNFVHRIVETRPSGALRTEFEPVFVDPASLPADWLLRRVAGQTTREDFLGTMLSDRSFSYLSGTARPEIVTDVIQRRDATTPTPESAVSSFAYDGYGNVAQETLEVGSGEDIVAEHCYDGDLTSWCSNPSGHSSRSVRIATRRTLTQADGSLGTASWHFTPDDLTGSIVETASGFADEPAIKRILDPFGRVVEERAKPEGGSWFVRAVWDHEDLENDLATGAPPRVVEQRYSDRSKGDWVETAQIGDGFGGVWKTIAEGPNGNFIGTATFRDPMKRLHYETYPIDCAGDSLCGGVSGAPAGGHPAMTTKSDALGRPIRVDDPAGFSLVNYERIVLGTVSADRIVTKNPKGDVTARAMDGDRILQADECDGTTPSATAFSCVDPVETTYGYEADGLVSWIEQASSEAVSPRLTYHYDTRGLVREIDDPDGGISFTDYDLQGNLVYTKNARGQETFYTPDELGRVRLIEQVEGNVAFTYPDGQRQASQELGPGYQIDLTYDDMGRLQQKRLAGGTTLYTDFESDELGRRTAVKYPDLLGTVVKHEYEGAYLERVCEVAALGDTCQDATYEYIEDVVYDGLGRRDQVVTLAGTRGFTYTDELGTGDETRRLHEESFTSIGSAYQRTLTYSTFDEVGNPLTVNAAGSGLTFNASYGFDDRNRLASWSIDSNSYQYGYNELGNLTNNAGANQVFDSPLSGPHAIDARTVDTDLYSYTYDDDGNCITESGPTDTKHLGFDSQNRLTCVGSAVGVCDTMRVYYDASGNRVRATVATGEYLYVDDLVTLHDEPGVGPERWADFHIWAFGEELARYRIDGIPLRSVETFPWPRVRWDGPVPWLIAITSAGSVFYLLILLVPWTEAARRRPAEAGLAVTLVVLLVLPPTTVGAGGGGDGATRYRDVLVSDRLGSVGAIVAEDGSLVREVVYQPFGGVHAEAGAGRSGAGNVYAGHRSADEVGLYYMKARWQNPKTGAFLSVDPVVPDAADPQAFNPYSYARNNPIGLIDPTGMAFDCYGNCGNPADAPPGWKAFSASQLGTSYTATAHGGPAMYAGRSQSGPATDLPDLIANAGEWYQITIRSEGVSFEGHFGGQGLPAGAMQFAGPGAPPSPKQFLIDTFVLQQQRIVEQLTHERSELQALNDADTREAGELRRKIDEIEKGLVGEDGNYRPKIIALGGWRFIREQRAVQAGYGRQLANTESRILLRRSEIWAIDRRIGWHQAQIRWADGGFNGPRPSRP